MKLLPSVTGIHSTPAPVVISICVVAGTESLENEDILPSWPCPPPATTGRRCFGKVLILLFPAVALAAFSAAIGPLRIALSGIPVIRVGDTSTPSDSSVNVDEESSGRT